MKYSDLIQFDPIETVIELRSADDKKKAKELVSSYVMSDAMADLVNSKIISQLQLDKVVDNKGVLNVGNYGTGKSHLMSLISAVASDVDMLALAQNEKFREDAACIAGKFEVLRIEIGATSMSLRGILTSNIEKDLKSRGISYTFPDVSTITNNKDALIDMMVAFAEKYGDEKGYLVVVDELLDYLKTRKDTELMADLGFMREIGEIIKTTRFRFISGVQEALFDNPAFHQVSSSLLKMKDRYEQVLIRSEDIAYVAKNRVLNKTPEQKAMIREHLQKFCPLYQNMADRLEEYVDMFPIHPAYIDTFQHIITVEKREVLKTISETIGSVINDTIDPDSPCIISYDTYWKRIKENPSLRTDASVHEVLSKSTVLEDIVSHSSMQPAYRNMALQIISALSVHRLTTGTLDAKLGLTAQNMKDDLCLFQKMPVMEEDFLLTTIQTVLKNIMTIVSGQFIEYNQDNGQYYLDLKKDIDYLQKIREKADFLGDDRLNSYFHSVMIAALEWKEPQHVTGHNIYQYNLNWQSKNIFRRGYLFLGNANERPTAQPDQDFYVYLLPPFGGEVPSSVIKDDEVYFTFQGDADFIKALHMYGGAKEMEEISAAGEAKTAYAQHAKKYLSDMRKWLDSHKTVLFKVTYQGTEKPLLEYLKGANMSILDVKGAVDIAASRALDGFFTTRYPDQPKFAKPITKDNMAANRGEAIQAIVGKGTELGNSILKSFGMILDGKYRPENSKYIGYYISKLNALPEGNVLNYDDIMTTTNGEEYHDIQFKLDDIWMSVILTGLVSGGYCILVAGDGRKYDAGNMEALAKINPLDLYNFKRLEKPKTVNFIMLKRLFNDFDVSTGLLASETTYNQAAETLLKAVKERGDAALMKKVALGKNPMLWGELLISESESNKLQEQLDAVHSAADDIRSRFTTGPKLKNFDFDDTRMTSIEQGLSAMEKAVRALEFKDNMADLIQYISTAESKIAKGNKLADEFVAKKQGFMDVRNRLLDDDFDTDDVDDLVSELEELKKDYIEYYKEEHKKYRLDHAGSTKKGNILQSTTVKALQTLKNITGAPYAGQLATLTSQIGVIKTCYQCTSVMLDNNPECTECHFNPADNDLKPVAGKMEYYEGQFEDLLANWTNWLLQALDDPALDEQLDLITKSQRAVIDKFKADKVLPVPVDQHFVDAINAVLSELESVDVNIDTLKAIMTSWGPCAPEDFKTKLSFWIDQQVAGHDKSKVRIVVK